MVDAVNCAVEAQRALAEVSNLQRAILDNAGYAIIATTTEGTIISFNPAAERMLGYRADELVGKETPACFHDLDEVVRRAGEFSAELGETIEPGFEVFVAKARRDLPNEHEWTYVHKDGRRFPVLLSITALRDSDGAITGFLGMARDITERRQAQQALAEEEAACSALAAAGIRPAVASPGPTSSASAIRTASAIARK